MSWPPDLRDALANLYEGDIVSRLVSGEPPFEREMRFEPSLLPHLARLCHPQSIQEVAQAALIFHRWHPCGWPQIMESTLNILVSRFPDEEVEGATYGQVSAVNCQVRRCVMSGQPPSRELRESVESEADAVRRDDWMARLSLVDPQLRWLDHLRRTTDENGMTAEGARALVHVLRAQGVDDLEPWLGDLQWASPYHAHLIGELPSGPARTQLADALVDLGHSLPPWWTALVVRRVHRFASDGVAWDFEQFWDPENVWVPFLRSLLRAEPANSLHEEMMQGHPFAHVLAGIEGPHETTIGLGEQVLSFWAGAGPPAMAEPEETRPDETADRGGSGSGAGEPQAGAVPPPAPPPARDERRLGVDAYLGDLPLERALVADVDLRLRVSIGHEATAQVGTPIEVEFQPGQEKRVLQVRLVVGEEFDASKPMVLPRDASRSASTEFSIRVKGPRLSALVLVYDEDRTTTLQAAHLTADVVESSAAEQAAEPSIQIRVIDASTLAALARPNTSATIVSDGTTAVASARELNLRATVDNVEDVIATMVQGIQTNAANFLAARVPIDRALVAMAKMGARLRTDLGIGPLDEASPIQVVSFHRQNVLPVEWVYGAETPDADATVCADWFANSAGTLGCPACDARDAAAQRRVVCPSRFWGLSKVIEHHYADEAAGPDFVARVQRTPDEAAVALHGNLVVSASKKVFEELAHDAGTQDPRELLADLLDAGANVGTVTLAGDWSAWRDAVAQRRPVVLIAMPHQEQVNDAGFRSPGLELGGVFETAIGESHVRAHGAQPGPVVMLLGCNTGVEDHLLTSFAARFRDWAPAVVATVGEVLAEEAQLVAMELLKSLSLAAATEGMTVGDAVRDARARLVHQSRLAGFQLTLHGDATWTVGG